MPCSFHRYSFIVHFRLFINRKISEQLQDPTRSWQASPIPLTGVYRHDQLPGLYSLLQHANAMNIYLAWTGTILYWIGWPIGIVLFYVFVAVVAILKLIYWPIAFILQPVVHLLRFITAVLALPFRALVKLEVRAN